MKSLNLSRSIFVAVLAILSSTSVLAAQDVKVKLSGKEEVPAVETDASATAKISIADDRSVTGSVETKKIEATAVHIHVGAPGESGPPIVTFVKGEGDKWNAPAGAKFNNEQYTAFKEGKLYVNVHSAKNPRGEIRGQLKP
ncbi:MAG: CHRD domain-containing protein [Spongiibacteraceae bacterium]